jgi:hypothetical protein
MRKSRGRLSPIFSQQVVLHRFDTPTHASVEVGYSVKPQETAVFHFTKTPNLLDTNGTLRQFLSDIPVLPHYGDLKLDEQSTLNQQAVSKVEITINDMASIKQRAFLSAFFQAVYSGVTDATAVTDKLAIVRYANLILSYIRAGTKQKANAIASDNEVTFRQEKRAGVYQWALGEGVLPALLPLAYVIFLNHEHTYRLLPAVFPDAQGAPPLRMDMVFELENQKLFLHQKPELLSQAHGSFDFSFLPSGVTLACSHSKSTHAAMAGYQPVILAGEAAFKRGRLDRFNDKSGAFGRSDHPFNLVRSPFPPCLFMSYTKACIESAGNSNAISSKSKSIPSMPFCHGNPNGQLDDIEDLGKTSDSFALDGLPKDCPRGGCAFFNLRQEHAKQMLAKEKSKKDGELDSIVPPENLKIIRRQQGCSASCSPSCAIL